MSIIYYMRYVPLLVMCGRFATAAVCRNPSAVLWDVACIASTLRHPRISSYYSGLSLSYCPHRCPPTVVIALLPQKYKPCLDSSEHMHVHVPIRYVINLNL